MCVCTYAHSRTMARMWKYKSNLWEPVLTFHFVGSRDAAQALGPGSQCPNPLSHFFGPRISLKDSVSVEQSWPQPAKTAHRLLRRKRVATVELGVHGAIAVQVWVSERRPRTHVRRGRSKLGVLTGICNPSIGRRQTDLGAYFI